MSRQRTSWVRGLILLLAAAALAALGFFLLFGRPDPVSQPAESTPTTPAPLISPPPTTVLPTPEQPEPIETGPEPIEPPTDKELQRLLDQSSPANLSPDQEKALVALGSRVLIADLTGKGRAEFADYFRGETGPPRAVHTNVRIRAGIARAVSERSDQVDVTLIWSSRGPKGELLEEERSTIRLAYANGRWVPVNDVGPNPSP